MTSSLGVFHRENERSSTQPAQRPCKFTLVNATFAQCLNTDGKSQHAVLCMRVSGGRREWILSVTSSTVDPIIMVLGEVSRIVCGLAVAEASVS